MRIVAMMMIIAHHLALHGIFNCDDNIYNSGSVLNRLVAQFYFPGGEVGVGLFFMISGYFLVKSDKKTKLLKLLLQIVFYGILLSVLALYIYRERGEKFQILSAINYLLVPISSVKWWFATYYILVLLLAPYINPFLMKLNKKGFVMFLIILYMIEYQLQWILITPLFRLCMASLFYCLGAYLQLHTLKLNKVGCISIFTLSWIVFSLSRYLETPFYNIFDRLLVVICCVSGFVFFSNLNFKSETINLIAKTTFGIYLFHDNDIIRNFLWNNVFRVVPSQYSSANFWMLSIVTIISVFFIGMTIDYFRMRFFEPHYLHFAERAKSKISNYIFNK